MNNYDYLLSLSRMADEYNRLVGPLTEHLKLYNQWQEMVSPILQAAEMHADILKGITAFDRSLPQHLAHAALGAWAVSPAQISVIQSALSQMGTLSGLERYNNMSFLDSLGLDQARLTAAVGLALQSVPEGREVEPVAIEALTAECYEAGSEEEKEALKNLAAPAGMGERTEKQKKFSAIVWMIVVFLLKEAASGAIQTGIDRLIGQDPPVINQYYIQNITNNLVTGGYDVETLSIWGFRIVNRDSILRAQPGCSARITGRLPRGRIVQAVCKHRKWVQVTWRDGSGEAQFGWIQNYKLTALAGRSR